MSNQGLKVLFLVQRGRTVLYFKRKHFFHYLLCTKNKTFRPQLDMRKWPSPMKPSLLAMAGDLRVSKSYLINSPAIKKILYFRRFLFSPLNQIILLYIFYPKTPTVEISQAKKIYNHPHVSCTPYIYILRLNCSSEIFLQFIFMRMFSDALKA